MTAPDESGAWSGAHRETGRCALAVGYKRFTCSYLSRTAGLLLLLALIPAVPAATMANASLEKPRLIVITDIGTEPDDIHFSVDASRIRTLMPEVVADFLERQSHLQ